MVDDAARRRALRAVARRHHPDVGGDPEAYVRAVEAVERRFRHGLDPSRPVVEPVHVVPSARWRLVLRRVLRHLRRWRRRRQDDRRRATETRLRDRSRSPRSR
jgi:hypothetical protein